MGGFACSHPDSPGTRVFRGKASKQSRGTRNAAGSAATGLRKGGAGAEPGAAQPIWKRQPPMLTRLSRWLSPHPAGSVCLIFANLFGVFKLSANKVPSSRNNNGAGDSEQRAAGLCPHPFPAAQHRSGASARSCLSVLIHHQSWDSALLTSICMQHLRQQERVLLSWCVKAFAITLCHGAGGGFKYKAL